ncbi:hypothetical protein PHLCEN_2v11368 [Hermanssonia centrifuga]|nr:hypothetical protein PHLCEN_2v11368 [Hermanssonia centrifuga]
MTPEPLRTPEPEVYATPVASRKRGRSPDVGEDEDEVMSVNGLPNSEEAASPAQPSASQETNISEIQIRRKRIRH